MRTPTDLPVSVKDLAGNEPDYVGALWDDGVAESAESLTTPRRAIGDGS